MSGNLGILLLAVPRRLDPKVAGAADQVGDLTHRLTVVEQRLGGVVAAEALHRAGATVRLDRVDAHLDRIERRMGRIDRPGAG